jgi:D-arabinono-1,4-lactone oxidase
VNTVAEGLQAATANLTPPFAVVDLDALDSNVESMITRAHGLPRLLRNEGAGEVQTPLRGGAATALQVDDQVWFRHAKAGEQCERIATPRALQRVRVRDLHYGRPHWGKLHTLDADLLRPLYPRLDDFIQIHDRLDPGRTFDNAYLRNVLGS